MTTVNKLCHRDDVIVFVREMAAGVSLPGKCLISSSRIIYCHYRHHPRRRSASVSELMSRDMTLRPRAHPRVRSQCNCGDSAGHKLYISGVGRRAGSALR